MAILDLPSKAWLSALSLDKDSVPRVLILEGTWWRKDAERERLSRLSDVHETAFPEIYTGWHRNIPVAYCCAYGAARAVEPAHIFAQIGTPLIVQIGTCGAMDPNLAPGDVAVPEIVAARDGLSPLYGAGDRVRLDGSWARKARQILEGMELKGIETRHLTWPSLFAQTNDICAGWAEEGLDTVDMETSAVGAVANRYGVAAVALLSVWDGLAKGQTFLDPLEPDASGALKRSNAAVFEVALELARQVRMPSKASG